MTESCIFCQIINKTIPAEIVYEDDQVIAFDDIHPRAPVHKLIVPKEHIATINDLQPKHNGLIGHIFQVAKNLAKEFEIDQTGYRLIMNCNRDAGQIVFHLHMHLIGGRRLRE